MSHCASHRQTILLKGWRPDHPDLPLGFLVPDPGELSLTPPSPKDHTGRERSTQRADRFRLRRLDKLSHFNGSYRGRAKEALAGSPPPTYSRGVVTLIVVHSHFRPGGVRRVIELAVPHMITYGPQRIQRVVLASGEVPDDTWIESFRKRMRGIRVEVTVKPSFGYLSESSTPSSKQRSTVRSGARELLRGRGCGGAVVWAHNLGLGRNVWLARELARGCHLGGIPLVVHHHDWWFENRWSHYTALRDAGCRSLKEAARSLIAESPWIAHAAINEGDARILARHFRERAGWLPNPVERLAPVSASRVDAARAWLQEQLGEDAPVWLLPCRLLRRKNIAEALLLTRWLRPEAWLVTTADVSSAAETTYGARLSRTAQSQGWRLRLAVLRRNEPAAPSVAELLAASEAVVLTSVQEGFGLPYLEAAAARRPLVARGLPNIAPDLDKFGFTFPQSYRDILVDPELFDWQQERQRQRQLFTVWRSQMPPSVRRLVEEPAVMTAREAYPVPFSRLTLTAQLEVLTHPPEHSWARCGPLNPFLAAWRQRAISGTLQVSRWPRSAKRWLSGRAYAERFFALVPSPCTSPPHADASVAAQAALLSGKLSPENLYPLLWHSKT